VLWEDRVALCAVLALHLVNTSPAPLAHEAKHAALVYDLDGLGKVLVEEEVQAAGREAQRLSTAIHQTTHCTKFAERSRASNKGANPWTKEA
jgi:hypothetical protein